MRVPFFRVAERKEPKKGRPHCLRPLRFATGQPVVLGFGGVSLELAPFHFAQTIAIPDPPNPALLGASRGAKGAEHPHGPLLRSAQLAQRVALAPASSGRAQQRPVWMFCPPLPLWMRRGAQGLADQGSRVSERRAAARVERDPAKPEHRRLPRRAAAGTQTVGSPFLWFLSFGDAKERDSHAGRLPASALNQGMQSRQHTIESASLNSKYPFGLSLSKPRAALRQAQRERLK